MLTQDSARLKNIHGIGPKRFETITSILSASNQTIDDLFNMSATAIKEKFQLPTNVAEAIANTKRSTNAKTSKSTLPIPANTTLDDKNIKMLDLNSSEYPERLRTLLQNSTPSPLYIWGNLDLLQKTAVGFCGSRSASEKGLQVTADVAAQITELGWVVVSGHAAGVDTTAHRVALETGGSTIIVAPQGILDFKLRRELKKIAKPEQLLIISEFPPKAGWNAGYAMKRNRTIIGLSNAMVLIESRTEGGTFEAGKESLKLKIPLFVAMYETPAESAAGNDFFLKKGASKLGKNIVTGRANIEPLRQAVTVGIRSPEKTHQLELIPLT